MVVAPSIQTRTLHHTTGDSCTDSGDDQQRHELRLHRLKAQAQGPPEIFYEISHIGRLLAWIPSRLAWTPALRGRDLSLLHPILPKVFTGTNNQDSPETFDTYTQYMLWDSGFIE